MRRYLHKPKEVSTREYVSRVIELNNYFKYYPVDESGNAPSPIPTDELMDNLEFGTPKSWQLQMLIGGHDPVAMTTEEFVELYERYEEAELDGTHKSASAPQNSYKSEGKAGKKRK